MHQGEITERRWTRFVQNFLTKNGEEQVAILKQPESYLYLTPRRLYNYPSNDNGAPHLGADVAGDAALMANSTLALNPEVGAAASAGLDVAAHGGADALRDKIRESQK